MNQVSDQKDANNKQTKQPSSNKSLMSTRVIAPTRKIMRQLNEYENSYEQRFSKKNEIIESM